MTKRQMRKNKQGLENLLLVILFMICSASVVVSIYSTLTYGQTIIHSDTATAILLNQSQMDNHSFFPESWKYVNGEIWVLGMNVWTVPFYAIMDNMVLARCMGTALVILVTSISLVLFSEKMWKSHSAAIAVPLCLLFLRDGIDKTDFSFVNSISDNIIYQGAYVSQMLWMILVTYLTFSLLKANERSKWKSIVLYAIVMIICCMAGTRAWAELTGPILAANIILFFWKNQNTKLDKTFIKTFGKLLKLLAIIISPAIIGYFIYKILISVHGGTAGVGSAPIFSDSVLQCWNNFVTAITNFFVAFGYINSAKLFSWDGILNAISAIVCIFIIFVIPFMQFQVIKSESEEVQYFFMFGMVHNLIMILMVVWCGYTATRYLLSSIFVCILISSRYIWENWIKRNTIWSILFSLGFCAVASIIMISMVGLSGGWKEKLEGKKELVSILKDNGLTKGYATYWNAYNNELYSNMEIEFGGIKLGQSSIRPYYWLVDEKAFEEEEGNSFVMLTDSENQSIRDSLFEICGEPINSIHYKAMNIYVFDYDVISRFKEGKSLENGTINATELDRSDYVRAGEDHLTIYPAGVVYGPYAHLSVGEYEVCFWGDYLNYADVDIFSSVLSGQEQLVFDEIERGENYVRLSLRLLKDADDLEFRMYNNTESESIVLRYITIE